MKFNYLSEDEVIQVHEASLEMLGTIGIHTTSDRFKKLLLANRCQENEDRIMIPREVVEQALKPAFPN